VAICTSCGRESAGDFRFCPYCGTSLGRASPAREQRKTVTLLFCDVAGSTALGDSRDPEALKAVLQRYFLRMKGIVEQHGGTVEKFIGDAVLAVFGVPILHEDDALRACRAALAMRDAFPSLGMSGRIGVNTGEVVTHEEKLVTGDAVNVAARLEQAAAPGDVLVGAGTLALVRGAVTVEPVGPLTLKGKSEPVPAFRLLSASGEPSRRFATPMVGRATELTWLRQTFARVVSERSCRLFTILGAAGVGKSRLAAEFLRGTGARVVRGRCLSYGEGITYWPVIEVVKQLDALPAGDAAEPIRALLGETAVATSAEAIAWAFRKLLEQEADERPLICVFDDLHWAEETLLDLIENATDLARDAQILIVCMARPELLERRASWGVVKWNSTTILLEPLDTAETEELLDALGGVEPTLRARIARAAEGNPLFLEEMLALVQASGDGEIAVPPTIHALLAARLDQLEPGERGALERGSVEGRVFHEGAVQALAGGEPQAPRLVALVRKQLVRPDRPQFAGEEAYRFRHLLIRDAAYDGLPKAARADLHERFADWLLSRAGDLVELDEILGHHLEQAARFKAELEQPDSALADRAAERLAAAGRRALERGDDRAAVSLLERALALTRPLRLDVRLEVDLAQAVGESDPREAAAISERAAERAAALRDEAGEALARLLAARYRIEFAAKPPIDELEALASSALPLLERSRDHAGLVHVWNAASEVAMHRGRWGWRAEGLERAIEHARLAGRPPTHWVGLVFSYVLGPDPADEVLRRLDRLPPESRGPRLDLNRARLLAMLDRPAEAWSLALRATERLRELSTDDHGDQHVANIAILLNDHETAARHLAIFCAWLEQHHQRNLLSTYAPMLGRSLCALGRHGEAEALARQGRKLGDEQDGTTQALWRQVQALVHAARGEHADAERLAREAVAITETTDGLNYQGDALCDLAEVLAASGRGALAAASLTQALDRYERKSNVAMVRRVHERFAELRLPVAAE
jgi:class 3 adenylate cyclase